jgi:hypothetical protein
MKPFAQGLSIDLRRPKSISATFDKESGAAIKSKSLERIFRPAINSKISISIPVFGFCFHNILGERCSISNLGLRWRPIDGQTYRLTFA